MNTFFEIKRNADGRFRAWYANGTQASKDHATPDEARAEARALWGSCAPESRTSLTAFPPGAKKPAAKASTPKPQKEVTVEEAIELAEKVLAQVAELRGETARVEKRADAVVGAIEGLTYLSPQARSGALDAAMGLTPKGTGNVEVGPGGTTLTLGAPPKRERK